MQIVRSTAVVSEQSDGTAYVFEEHLGDDEVLYESRGTVGAGVARDAFVASHAAEIEARVNNQPDPIFGQLDEIAELIARLPEGTQHDAQVLALKAAAPTKSEDVETGEVTP